MCGTKEGVIRGGGTGMVHLSWGPLLVVVPAEWPVHQGAGWLLRTVKVAAVK